MSTVQDLFQQAQLAEAAYADFSIPGISTKDALIANNFSVAQADSFITHWKVVDQSPPLGFFGNGFSATLFESLDNPGQYTLAIAGSVSPIDFANDLLDLNAGGVAYFQVQSMINYVLRLQAGSAGTTQQVELVAGATAPSLTSTPVGGVGPGIMPNQLTITGHSLGGFLGQVYQRIFGSAGVDTFNALGVVRPNAPVFDQLTSLLGLPPGSFSSGSGENLLVPGEPAQLIGTVQGKPQIQVFSETASVTINPIDTIPAHLMGPLTDSLAVYNLLATIDPALNTDPNGLAKITDLLKAETNVAANTLESTVNALGNLFVVSGTSFSSNEFDSNRDLLYSSIKDIAAALPTNGGLSLVAVDPATILTSAKADTATSPDALAYRYALVNGNPFVVTGADYGIHNNNGELDLFNTADHSGSLTNQYLTDRANYLKWEMQANTQDKSVLSNTQGTQNIVYDNQTTHSTLAVNGEVLGFTSTAPVQKIIFGSEFGDDGSSSTSPILQGGSEADRIYGMGGNDVLQGNGGNDYLEGGQGNDTYIWNTGDGFDSIRDTDGLGSIVFNSDQLNGGAQYGDNRTFKGFNKWGRSRFSIAFC